MSAEFACAYCHLPIPTRRARPERSDEAVIYCCYGCRLAAHIVGGAGDEGHAAWMLTRLGTAVVLSMAVMVFSLPMYGHDAYGAMGGEGTVLSAQLTGLLRYASLGLATPVFLLLGLPILSNALDQLRQGIASTDALVVMGVGATLVYSYVCTITDTGATYYETACMVLVLITLGRYLEATGKIKASVAVGSLESLLPDTVRVARAGRALSIGSSEVEVGDLVEVPAGERVAVDGVIESGEAQIDEQLISGESTPVIRRSGDTVRGGTINLDGALTVRATAVGSDATLGRLAKLLEEAKRSKGRYERLGDKVATAIIPLVVGLAGVGVVLGWARGGAEEGIMTALAVLLVSCPCALGIATPMVIWIAFGQAARRGVLFRNGGALEALADTRAVAFDKTGTLTTGEPTVVSVAIENGKDRHEVLAMAAGLGGTSRHVLSQSVAAYVHREGVSEARVGQGRSIPGHGLIGEVAGMPVRLGSVEMMEEASLDFGPEVRRTLQGYMAKGNSIACVGAGNKVVGVFAFAEALREEAAEAVAALGRLGCKVQVLTGDHLGRGRVIAKSLGVETHAALSPQDKIACLDELRRAAGPVAMVGDGLNDAPALAAADVGMAMACGADITREAARICLLGNDLTTVPWSVRLARRAVRTIKHNLAWAFVYNIVGIPLALSGRLSPAFAAGAMVVSSLIVITNSLRINTWATRAR